jgi:hypothetical protein
MLRPCCPCSHRHAAPGVRTPWSACLALHRARTGRPFWLEYSYANAPASQCHASRARCRRKSSLVASRLDQATGRSAPGQRQNTGSRKPTRPHRAGTCAPLLYAPSPGTVWPAHGLTRQLSDRSTRSGLCSADFAESFRSFRRIGNSRDRWEGACATRESPKTHGGETRR